MTEANQTRKLSDIRAAATKERFSTVLELLPNNSIRWEAAIHIDGDEIERALGIDLTNNPDMVEVWDYGCGTCGFGYTVDVGPLPYQIIDDSESDPCPG